jgi:iron complex transport system substrate-binding protein
MQPDHTPRRVVSLQPSVTATLAAIGRLDRLVACTKYCLDVCPELRNRGVAIVSDSWTASAKQIEATMPDLVIASVPYQEKAVVEILKAGARFLGLAPKTLADIYRDIASIAGVMGVPERGQQEIERMQQQIAEVCQLTNSSPRPRVFCEEWGKPLIASQRWVAELVEAAGGQFVGEPGARYELETIRQENPDVLIAAWCGAGDRVPLEKIIRDRGWEKMRAVQQGRVYCIPDEFLNTPASTLLQGLRALAAAIHPQNFPQPHRLRCITTVTERPPKESG